MGRPAFPTPAQIEALRKAATLPTAQTQTLKKGTLALTLEPHALALIEIGR